MTGPLVDAAVLQRPSQSVVLRSVVPAVLLHPWQIVMLQCWHVQCLAREQPAKRSKADGPRRAGWAFKNAEPARPLLLRYWLAQPVLALYRGCGVACLSLGWLRASGMLRNDDLDKAGSGVSTMALIRWARDFNQALSL